MTVLKNLSETNRKYKLIIADPPWSYHLWKVRVNTPPSQRRVRMASAFYDTLTTQDICNLRVPEITDDNCALMLWVTSPLIQDGLDVMKAWGFNYKTFGVIWIKTTKNNKLKCGLGSYSRPSVETCLLGIKGTVKVLNHGVRQTYVEDVFTDSLYYPTVILFHDIMEHSTKPKIHTICETLFGKIPRIELFARDTSISGWDYWGDQI